MTDTTYNREGAGQNLNSDLFLTVTRLIPATPEEVFAAWTVPDVVARWWGPKGVTCIGAEIDLRIGGRYRIGNRMPDRSILWIGGEYLQIEPTKLLVFTWGIDGRESPLEQVSITFREVEYGTEVSVRHEHIGSSSLREEHRQGWIGCLAGLNKYLDGQ